MQLQTPLKKARRSNYPPAWLHECQCYQHMKVEGVCLCIGSCNSKPPLKKPGGRTSHWHGFINVNTRRGLSLHWNMQLQTPPNLARWWNCQRYQRMMGFVFALEHATPNPLKKARWSNYPLAWFDACQCYQHMRGLFLHLNMQLQTPLKKARRSNLPLAWFHACQCYRHMKGFVFALEHATPNPPKKSLVVELSTGMV